MRITQLNVSQAATLVVKELHCIRRIHFLYLLVVSRVTFVPYGCLMVTNCDVEALSEVIKYNDKFINTSTIAKVPQLKDIESGSTNNNDN